MGKDKSEDDENVDKSEKTEETLDKVHENDIKGGGGSISVDYRFGRKILVDGIFFLAKIL